MTHATPPPTVGRPVLPTISGSALAESRLLLAVVRRTVAAMLART